MNAEEIIKWVEAQPKISLKKTISELVYFSTIFTAKKRS